MELDLGKFDRGVFLVNVLGIVFDPKTKKILIGKREKDQYIPKLTWCFPGGRAGYEKDIEYYLKLEIKKKTNIAVDVEKIIFAKTYPENRQLLSIYYLCKVAGGEEKAGEKFVELKWVNPIDVEEYFTTSLHPKILEFLEGLKDGFI